MVRVGSIQIAAVLLTTLVSASISSSATAPPPPLQARISFDLSSAAHNPRFSPSRAIGAGVDGLQYGDIDKTYTEPNIKAILSAGFKPLTYRLRTELGVEAWHWNPKGTWSDPAHQCGYWTSDPHPTEPILTCYGYRLPRRGATIDQANNDGYSRITDGDADSFWKSNPYLDPLFTKEPDTHPQWVAIDLGAKVAVDTIRIRWAEPFAHRIRVEYYVGKESEYLNDSADGRWIPFDQGTAASSGGLQTLRLADHTVQTRLIRIFLMESSHTAPSSSTDRLDRCGFAIREVAIGTLAGGRFNDAVRHTPVQAKQSRCWVSSTDPWHTSADLDKNVEQAGFDRVFQSGLTNGLPMMTPVGVLYDTPENAAAEIHYLRARHYPVDRIEMGEEPDGQLTLPEHYGALYLQFASAIHAVDPALKCGGPGFQSSLGDWVAWPDEEGETSYFARFLAFLQKRGRARDLAFFSVQWYPFDDAGGPPAPNLTAAPRLLRDILRRQLDKGLGSIPWIIAEYGYSAFSSRHEVDMAGALFDAETVARFLALGGATAYYYGYEPNELIHEADGKGDWGNLTLFLTDKQNGALRPVPAFYAASMLTKSWAQPGIAIHEIAAGRSTALNSLGDEIVSAYALKRPDGQVAILIINKDPLRSCQVSLTAAGARLRWNYPIDSVRYSAADYTWVPAGALGHAALNRPPASSRIARSGPITVAPFSLTVIRGRIAAEHQ